MLVHSFSAMVSPIPTPTPASLGILVWKPGAAERDLGVLARFSFRAPAFPRLHFPHPLPVFLPLFHPSVERGPPLSPARPLPARTPTSPLLPQRVFSPRSSVFPRLFTCSRDVLNI